MPKENFNDVLSIDKYRLNEECLSHAGIYFRYSDACADAKSQMNNASDNLALVKAQANIRIRDRHAQNNEKFTEALVASEIDVDEEVVKAKKEFRDAESNYQHLLVAVQALEARKAELDNLVRLAMSGFYASPMTSEAVQAVVNEDTSMSIRKNLNKE